MGSGMNTIADSTTEWWVSPLATTLMSPTQRTVYGAVSGDTGNGTAQVLACEINYITGAKTRIVADSVAVDDHNTPALWAMDGHRFVLAWTDHGFTGAVNLRVSDTAGTLSSLASTSLQTIAAPGGASYTQIHYIPHLSTGTQDTFWMFCRIGSLTWRMVPFSVNQITGIVTAGTWVHVLTGVGQAYISTADAHNTTGNQVIRVMWGHNPAAVTDIVYSFDIDVATGILTSVVDPAFIANMSGSNLPLTSASMTPLLPQTAAGSSRRLFYSRPGPMTHAVAYAEWVDTAPDIATYYVLQLIDGVWVRSSYGISGPRFGYNADANYIAGMAFPNPCTRDVVAVARVDTGVSSASIYLDGNERILASQSGTTRIIRPVFPIGFDDRLIMTHVMDYASYTDYHVFTRTAFPGDGNENRLQDGTKVLIY